MKIDPPWRQKIDAIRRSGLQYVARANFELKLDPREEAPATEAADPPLVHSEIASVSPEQEDHRQPMPRIKKASALEVLSAEVAQCTRCSGLASSRTQTVFSDGSANAELCFVGEAPGRDEDLQGTPFVGKAGQLLTKIIEACKLKREEVYICNVLKCRPPDNRNPAADEVENCRPFLERQLKIVRPKMMVALGKYAAAYLLNEKPEKTPILKLRGTIHEYCGIPFMITLHPAYLLRNPNAKRDVWEDMKTVMREIGRPVE